MREDKAFLLRALVLNAGFSATSAILMLLAAGWIAAQLGLPDTGSVYAVAVVLMLFAVQLGHIVRTGTIRRWEVWGIIAGDLAWVAASAVLVGIYHASLSTIGLVLVELVALVVLYFAVQQFRGLRRLGRRAPGQAAVR